MESSNINIKNLTKIPEKEFQQHFRDWMEQDHVARSLQAKLRKDLIANFNKTSLGKKIIAQTGVSHRLNLSPLLLALNTLAAEFLYAQNCHFTLSVFCTEVPYRNTLPDFESAHHFRFNEREIFEILDALSSTSSNFDMDTKQSICKEYNKKNASLLFVVLKNLLSKPMAKSKENAEKQPIAIASIEKEEMPQKSSHRIPKTTTSATTSDKLNLKVEYQSKNFRYLNKYLMILSRKMKEMSVNLDLLQKQQNHHSASVPPRTVKKSLQARKFENLNRNLEKISENLRHLSLSKRKNKRLSAVVTAVNAMALQFEKCLLNFDQLSKGMAKGSDGLRGVEKSYSDWIHEMRTSNNGKLFLEKIELSLRKAIHRERKKMETELKQRMQIQKDILKSKYKHKLTEELALSTSRTKIDNSQQANEIFEKKLNEFEVQHKELHLKIQEAEKRITIESSAKNVQPEEVAKSQITQTANNNTSQSIENLVNEQNQIQQMIKHISDQERQVDHIVFDAKLRVQELEHESNQLDRTFRDYLERQLCEKQKIRQNATSIWQSYALGKSMLDTKTNSHHRLNASSNITKIEKHPVMVFDRITPPDLTIPTISIDDVSATSISPPAAFENPFRVAKRKILTRSKKTLSKPSAPGLPLTESDDVDDSSAKNCTQDKCKQRPTVLRLIEHKDEDESEEIRTKMSLLLPNRTTNANGIKLAPEPSTQRLSPEFNIDDITLDDIELSPTTAKSSSVRSADSNSSSRGVFKLKRQLFSTDNVAGGGRPSSSPSNDDNKEPKEPLPQINDHQSVDNAKKSTEGHNNNLTLTKEITNTDSERKKPENKASNGLLGTSTGDVLGLGEQGPLKIMPTQDATLQQSSHLNVLITESVTTKKDST